MARGAVYSDLRLISGRIEGRAEVQRILREVSRVARGKVVDELKLFHRERVVAIVLERTCALVCHRAHRLSRLKVDAVLEGDEYAFRRTEEDAGYESGITAFRILIEMALSVSPMEGLHPSIEATDRLGALVHLMLMGHHAHDAVRYNLAKPELTVRTNGTVREDAVWNEAALNYVEDNQREGLLRYLASTKRDKTNRLSVDALDLAFLAEWGCSFGDCISILHYLDDALFEAAAQVSLGRRSRLVTRTSDAEKIPRRTVEAFLDAFSLPGRESLDKPPDGFMDRDVQLWRGRRRLSLEYRPIVRTDENEEETRYFYSTPLIEMSISEIINVMASGHDSPLFSSKEMKEIVTRIGRERARNFEDAVAAELRLRGWGVEPRFKMRHVGGSAGSDDVDVLSFREDGAVLVVECKRLRRVATPLEIGEQWKRLEGQMLQLNRRMCILNKEKEKLATYLGLKTCNIIHGLCVIDFPVWAGQVDQVLQGILITDFRKLDHAVERLVG